MKEPSTQQRNDVIAGRNAVLEAMKTGQQIDTLFLQQSDGPLNGSMGKIVRMAKEQKLVIKYVTKQKLNELSEGVVHQGVAALISAAEYKELPQLLEEIRAREEDPFLIICDEIEDPHNLGAIIRTAEAAGAHGVII